MTDEKKTIDEKIIEAKMKYPECMVFKVKYGYAVVEKETGGLMYHHRGKDYYMNLPGECIEKDALQWTGKATIDDIIIPIKYELNRAGEPISWLKRCGRLSVNDIPLHPDTIEQLSEGEDDGDKVEISTLESGANVFSDSEYSHNNNRNNMSSAGASREIKTNFSQTYKFIEKKANSIKVEYFSILFPEIDRQELLCLKIKSITPERVVFRDSAMYMPMSVVTHGDVLLDEINQRCDAIRSSVDNIISEIVRNNDGKIEKEIILDIIRNKIKNSLFEVGAGETVLIEKGT